MRYHQENEQRWNPDDPDLPVIRLNYCADGVYGEIRVSNTQLEEVEVLMNEPRDREESLRKLKPPVEWVN